MALQGYKTAAQSLTIRAGVIGAFFSILGGFGIHIAPELAPQLEAIVTGVSALVAIYGRFRAKTLIK